MPSTRFAGRIGRLPAQFFVQLVKKTEDMIAAGHDVINLGRGNPDQPAPPHIVEALARAARDPATHGYSPFSGLRVLREAAARWYRRRFGVELDPDREVAILIGSKIGLIEVSLCLLEPGDLCLMPDPGYPDYWSGVALAGGTMETMPLIPSNHFLPDYDAVAPSVAGWARLMFLCYPNNPTSAEFADLLLSKAHVSVAPGIGFGRHGDGYVRISLTTRKDRISEAVERVGRLKVFEG